LTNFWISNSQSVNENNRRDDKKSNQKQRVKIVL
jgi:hypothetical protein